MAVFCHGCCRYLALALCAAGWLSAPRPAAAQSLSEKLTRTIGAAQKAEVARNFEQALTVFDEALRVDADAPDLRRLLRERAKLLERLEEYPQVEKDLTAALKVAPVDSSLYLDRGYFYMRCGRYSDAMTDFMAGARRDPGNTDFAFAVGRVATALGRHELAVDSYDRALRLDPGNARAFLARAEANVHLGRLGRAHDDYANALRLALARPQDRFFAHLGRGYVAMRLGDLAAAVGDFNGALAIDPSSHQALAWRGYVFERQGRRDIALKDYERAAEVDPTDSAMNANIRRLRGNESGRSKQAYGPILIPRRFSLSKPRKGR